MLVVLLSFLVGALWHAARAWISAAASPMPASGYIFMMLGVVLSLALGFGLMALVFYSSRHGYDDEAADFSRLPDDDTRVMHRVAWRPIAACDKEKPPAGKSPGALLPAGGS